MCLGSSLFCWISDETQCHIERYSLWGFTWQGTEIYPWPKSHEENSSNKAADHILISEAQRLWDNRYSCFQFSSVHSLSYVQLFATPWTAACQASLSIINSQSLLKLMFIESVRPSNHLTLCCPLLLLPSIFPSIRVFSNESALLSGGQSIGVSTSASVLPMNIQDWCSLGWTGWISLQSKGLESSPTPQFKSINSLAFSFLYSPTLTSIHDYWKNHSLD